MNIRKLISVALLAAAPAASGFAADMLMRVAAEPIIAGTVEPSKTELDRGRYLVRVAGCNECHTPGYVENWGQVPEDSLLTGDTTAYEGRWGTTFPTNLRVSLLRFDDEAWLHYARSVETSPPMPWLDLRRMSDEDLLAILRFVQWLGPKGEPAPQPLPPGEPWIGTAVKYSAAVP